MQAAATTSAAHETARDLTPFDHNLPKLKHRTTGLRLVDALIYPIVNNFGVFGISVAATYLTSRGWPEPINGKALAPWKKSIGDVFKKRGQNLDNFFEHTIGMDKPKAQMSRMVFFSFADGTFVAPLVKVLEDRREKMALWIDTKLGTKPADESVYDAEPKQTWRSVVEGRLLTSLIVVPTAVLLSKKGWNEKWFDAPGLKAGERIEANFPKVKKGLEKALGNIHIPELFKTVYFEAFYTSVCTAGLYLISRSVAKSHPPAVKATPALNAPTIDQPQEVSTPKVAEIPAPMTEKPRTTVMQPTHMERLVSAAQGNEVTA